MFLRWQEIVPLRPLDHHPVYNSTERHVSSRENMSPLPIEINTVLDGLNTEIELIEASLLPVESLSAKARDALPLMLSVKSDESRLSLRVEVRETYPEKDAVKVEVKGDGIGREEAEIWKAKVQELMLEWDDQFEYVVCLEVGDED